MPSQITEAKDTSCELFFGLVLCSIFVEMTVLEPSLLLPSAQLSETKFKYVNLGTPDKCGILDVGV